VRRICSLLLAVALGVWCAPANAAGVQYHLTDLGTFGGFSSHALGINNLGQVVGYSFTATDHTNAHAFLFSNGLLNDLGQPYGGYTVAGEINDQSQIVGEGDNFTGSVGHGFLYANGSYTDLHTLGVGTASGINSTGQIAGTNTSGHAVLYSSGTATDLGTLGGFSSTGNDVSNNGMVVGESDFDSNVQGTHAFAYSNGTMKDLGTLGGTYCGANAINANGSMIVGSGYTVPYMPGGPNTTHAFLYGNGIMSDIAAFGSTKSAAYGINAGGQIVGFVGSNASLYDSGTWINLNTDLDASGTGWSLTAAIDINDFGWITGDGIGPDGHTHAFLLTPTPEPSLVGILGVFVLMNGRRICRREPRGLS
jgi:probable HAF family extracellular repeat protein